MEPLSVASAFASVVGLLHLYKSERKARLSEKDEQKADDIQHFLEWLRRHDHESVVTMLQGNTEMFRSLEETLSHRHDEIAEQLATLDLVITSIADRLDLLGPVARMIQQETPLSDQAIGILQEMNAADASRFIKNRLGRGGMQLRVMDGKGGSLAIPDPRFLDDDLQTLCNLSLLSEDLSPQGLSIYTITRTGAALGDQSRRN